MVSKSSPSEVDQIVREPQPEGRHRPVLRESQPEEEIALPCRSLSLRGDSFWSSKVSDKVAFFLPATVLLPLFLPLSLSLVLM